MLQNTITPPDTAPSGRRRRRRTRALTGGLVALLVLGTVLWWFCGRDTPDKVNIDAAASGIAANSAGTGAATGAGGLDGTWDVDTTTGDFDFDSATGTFAGFRIDEELAGIGATEAVGRTGDVSGSFVIDGTTVTDAQFSVDMTAITTNDSMRDRRVQEALATTQYPTAEFRLTEPIDLGAGAASGDTVEVEAKGELTIHGVTREVSIPLQARLVDGTAVVVGALDLSFADYGVTVPSSMKVVSVEDHGTVELQLLLQR